MMLSFSSFINMVRKTANSTETVIAPQDDEANAEREDDSIVPPRFLPLTGQHLEAALTKTVPTLRDSVIAPYVKFAQERGLNVPDYD